MVNVIVCDASSLNQEILGKFCSEGSAHHSGVWSEKDGCVYKPITCPFCPCENVITTVLGAQVLATDASNLQSLNEVLLFAERLDVKHEPSCDVKHEPSSDVKLELSSEQVARNQTGAVKPMSPPPVMDLEKFAYKPLMKNPAPLSTRRSKLRLPTTNNSSRPLVVPKVEDP